MLRQITSGNNKVHKNTNMLFKLGVIDNRKQFELSRNQTRRRDPTRRRNQKPNFHTFCEIKTVRDGKLNQQLKNKSVKQLVNQRFYKITVGVRMGNGAKNGKTINRLISKHFFLF